MNNAKRKETAATTAPNATAKKREPTPFEREALAAVREARDRRSPRLKLTSGTAGKVAIKIDDPDEGIGTIALMKAIGTSNTEFLNGLLGQLVNASKDGGPSESGANFMLAVVKGVEPRDQVEAMLAAQMAAVHMASMTFARRLAHVDNLAQQDSAERAFNKLTRTFAAQVEALKSYRTKGEQRMVVQHVNVADGGQAVIGSVNAAPAGGGALGKNGGQPDARQIADAQNAAMLCEIEAERIPVSRAGGERPADVSNARRD
jgi:hypothetical protein